MNWFLTRVYAETAGTAPVEEVSMGSYLLSMLLPVAIIIGLMYLVVFRPQKKKDALRDMINNLKVGDEITTIGGL